MTKKTAIIIIVLSLFGMSILSLTFKKFTYKNNVQNDIEEKEETKDTEAPVLTLKENKFIIYQGNDFNYDAFVISAIDNVDGDLKDKVKYTKQDLSNVGTYEIEYSVEDNAGNKAIQVLELIVREDLGL